MITHNVLYTGVRSAYQHNNTNRKDESVDDSERQVLTLVPLALLDQLEPHPGGEVESEAGDEQARADGEQVGEEGNGLGDDPGDDGGDANVDEPGGPLECSKSAGIQIRCLQKKWVLTPFLVLMKRTTLFS